MPGFKMLHLLFSLMPDDLNGAIISKNISWISQTTKPLQLMFRGRQWDTVLFSISYL